MKHLRQYIRKVLKEMKQATPTPGWGGSSWPGALPPRKTQKGWQRRYAKAGRSFWSTDGGRYPDKLVDMEGNVYEIASSKSAPIEVKSTNGDTYTITKSYFGGWNVEGAGYERMFDELHQVAEFLSDKAAKVI